MAPTDENGRVLEKGGKPRRVRNETRAAVERWDREEDELGIIIYRERERERVSVEVDREQRVFISEMEEREYSLC